MSTALDVRELVLAQLRLHNYTGKTTEIAQWTGLQPSVVRRACLVMANNDEVEAVLVPGRGKGEYRFTITQLDLFLDAKHKPTFWQKLKSAVHDLRKSL
jgi:DNA-binding IclR family transcriptional regulator